MRLEKDMADVINNSALPCAICERPTRAGKYCYECGAAVRHTEPGTRKARSIRVLRLMSLEPDPYRAGQFYWRGRWRSDVPGR